MNVGTVGEYSDKVATCSATRGESTVGRSHIHVIIVLMPFQIHGIWNWTIDLNTLTNVHTLVHMVGQNLHILQISDCKRTFSTGGHLKRHVEIQHRK